MRRTRLAPAATILMASAGISCLLGVAPAAAQGDAVEGFVRRVFGPPHHERRHAREPHRRSASKPKNEVKPSEGETAAARQGTPSSPATVPVPAPNPEARPEPATPDAAAATAAAPVPTPEAPPASPTQGAVESAPTPVPGKPDAVQPPPIESQPPEDIPVPEKRPATAPVQAAPAPAAAPVSPPAEKAHAEGQAGAEPSKPDDAPNSTDKLKSREPTIDPATAVVAAAAIEDAESCEAELKKRGVVFEVKPSISEGECGVLRPVSFERSSAGVKVSPGTQLLCRAALALDIWLSDSVVPAAKANFPDRKLTEFRQASTYVCRPRASESGISEHARGSAIDIGAFAFDKGADIGIAKQADGSPEARFQDAVRAGACGPFKTVLGPGTDPDHATHFHLDIAARRNGATYCK